MNSTDPYRPPSASLELKKNRQELTLNPWLSIWTQPRETIQQIVDTDPRQKVLFLAAIGGFADALNQLPENQSGSYVDWPLMLVITAVVGAIAGIIVLYIAGWLLSFTGRWLGGTASPLYVRAALAWSEVPSIWALLLWIPMFALFGPAFIMGAGLQSDPNPALAFVASGFVAAQLVIGIWALVIFLNCLGQVQGFSAWRALGNSILAGLIAAIPIVIIVMGVIFATRLGAP